VTTWSVPALVWAIATPTALKQPSLAWQYAVDVAQIVTAIGAIIIPVTIAVFAWLRRPSVFLEEDTDRIQSRPEGTSRNLPHVRLLACNKGWRRAGHGTRVIVEGYRPQGRPVREMVTLGSPLLGWPSAPQLPDGGLSIFPGLKRPIDFGQLVPLRPAGSPQRYAWRHPVEPEEATWHFRLGLAFGLTIADGREAIPPGSWIVRLTIGADEGSARTYDVDVAWQGDEPDADAALASILDHLAVRRAEA